MNTSSHIQLHIHGTVLYTHYIWLPLHVRDLQNHTTNLYTVTYWWRLFICGWLSIPPVPYPVCQLVINIETDRHHTHQRLTMHPRCYDIYHFDSILLQVLIPYLVYLTEHHEFNEILAIIKLFLMGTICLVDKGPRPRSEVVSGGEVPSPSAAIFLTNTRSVTSHHCSISNVINIMS